MRLRDELTCQHTLWRGSRSFAAASVLLPLRVWRPTAAIYAFCRVSDDVVDEPGAGPEALAQLRRRLDRAYQGQPLDHAVDRAFADVVRQHRIPRALPEALLEGYAWDLQGRSYETLPELRAYCARVASTVGGMMTLLMDRRDPATLARACDLGVAMQLTNVARDVGEDARSGRIYLPRQWLEQEGVDPRSLGATPVFTPALGRVVSRLLGEAQRLYARADAGIARLPRDCRLAIAAARAIYADIGRVIAARGYDSVSGRAYTSGRRKLRLMAATLPWLAARPEAAAEPPLPETAFLVEAAAR